MPDPHLALRLAGVGHRFGRATALSRVDLSVAPGERVHLAGANGAGKTTLLRIGAGVVQPESGVVRVFGRSPREPAVRGRLRFLGPGDGFYPALTGNENLSHFARLAGLAERVGGALASVGLTSARDRLVGGYSTGMRRRLALARMALGEADLYLLDEPWRGLDSAGAAWLDAWLDSRRTAGVAWLLVTHDSERGRRHAGRAVYIEDGSVRTP